MLELSKEMKFTLTELLKECISEAHSGRTGGTDPNKYPSQILCLAELVQFTARCEEAIRMHNLQVADISLRVERGVGYPSIGGCQSNQSNK